MNNHRTILSVLASICLSGCAALFGSGSGLGAVMSDGAAGSVVFANAEYPDYTAAAQHAVKEVRDGDEVWMYVKFPGPLANYVGTGKTTHPDGTVSETAVVTVECDASRKATDSDTTVAEQAIFLKGGNKSSARLENIDVTTQNELKIYLSKYVRHKSSFVMLKCITKNQAEPLNVRLLLKGKNLDVITSSTLTGLFDSGFPTYMKQWNAYDKVLTSGDILDNELPPIGKFSDAKIRDAIATTVQADGISAPKIYFTMDAWRELSSTRPNVLKERLIYAFALYKKDGQWMFMRAEIHQLMGGSGKWSAPSINLYDKDSPLDPSQLPK